MSSATEWRLFAPDVMPAADGDPVAMREPSAPEAEAPGTKRWPGRRWAGCFVISVTVDAAAQRGMTGKTICDG